MASTKHSLKVFLCHAHADRDAVQGLYSRLIKDGVDAWLDKEKLLGGADWEYEIRNAVRESDVVLVCHSRQFNQRGFRQKEVKIALEEADLLPRGEIFIIPVRLEECDVLDDLQRWHWVDLFEKDGYERLLRALRVRAEKIGLTLQIKKNWSTGFTLPNQNPPKADIKNKVVQVENKENFLKKYRATMFNVVIVGAVAVLLWVAMPKLISQINNFLEMASGPSATSVPTQTQTNIFASLPTEITDTKGVSMLLVPAGEFIMGNDKLFTNERPSHTVNLDAFYIDDYEVTNALYKACVETQGGCIKPDDPFLYNNASRANHPVVRINWNMAKSYCEWRGARLPTEAEWEKAARGENGLTYPWSIDSISINYANYNSSDTKSVGSYPSSRSPYRVHDMAGNVSEWVFDWYSLDYYQFVLDNNILNPTGPLTSPFSSTHNDYGHVFRGGSWKTTDGSLLRTTYRSRATPDFYADDLGFRCAKDATP